MVCRKSYPVGRGQARTGAAEDSAIGKLDNPCKHVWRSVKRATD